MGCCMYPVISINVRLTDQTTAACRARLHSTNDSFRARLTGFGFGKKSDHGPDDVKPALLAQRMNHEKNAGSDVTGSKNCGEFAGGQIGTSDGSGKPGR